MDGGGYGCRRRLVDRGPGCSSQLAHRQAAAGRSLALPHRRGSTLREAFEQGWERSKTIRGQCEELAAARAVVVLEWVATDSFSHARTGMAVRGGVVVATVRIPPVGDTIVLLAHELQHVIEKTRGLDVEAEAKRPDRACGRPPAATKHRGR